MGYLRPQDYTRLGAPRRCQACWSAATSAVSPAGCPDNSGHHSGLDGLVFFRYVRRLHRWTRLGQVRWSICSDQAVGSKAALLAKLLTKLTLRPTGRPRQSWLRAAGVAFRPVTFVAAGRPDLIADESGQVDPIRSAEAIE